MATGCGSKDFAGHDPAFSSVGVDAHPREAALSRPPGNPAVYRGPGGVRSMARLIRVGDWSFDPDGLTIDRDTHPTYQIDVELLRTSAEVLDWIFQLRAKTWFTPQDSHDLLKIVYVVMDPQANLCSWGAERGPIDPAAVASGARGRVRDWAH